MRNKYYVLLLIILGNGLFLFAQPSVAQISHSNRDILDRNIPPKAKGNFPDIPFHANGVPQNFEWEPIFPTKESVNRTYPVQQTSSEYFVFDVPSTYDYGVFNITCSVMSATVNEQVVVSDNINSVSRYEQAQEFFISEKGILSMFSVYLGDGQKQDVQAQIQIRNNSYDGDILYQTNHLFDSGGWNEISIFDQLILDEGIYYLRMNSFSQPSRKAWGCTNTGVSSTNTWRRSGANWGLANYDLSLKIYTRTEISPEDVNLKLNGESVINSENKIGQIQIIEDISSSDIIIDISSDEPILLTYWAESYFIRNFNSSLVEQIISDEYVTWNIMLDTSYLDVVYDDYSLQILDLKENYYDFLLYNGPSPISYTILDDFSLKAGAQCNKLTFKSPNDIEIQPITQTIEAGKSLKINAHAHENGFLMLNIKAGENEIYTNFSESQSSITYDWNVPTDLPSSDIIISLTYYGDNQYAYRNSILNFRRIGEILYQDINTYALGKLNIDCYFYDFLLNTPLENANIYYSLEDMSGNLEQNSNGNYSRLIDLNQFALKPGEYSLNLNGYKEGYNEMEKEIPITLHKRDVLLQLSQSLSQIHPGQSIELSLNLMDNIEESALLRNVDVKYTIYQDENSLFTFWSNGINRDDSLTVEIPSEYANGEYDLVIEIVSDYYYGELEISNAFSITPIPDAFWGGYYFILSAVGGLYVLTTWVSYQKNRTKKSIKGIIILHDDSVPLADLLCEELSKNDAILVSGAVTGTMAIIREITGKELQTIGVQGGYVTITRSDSYNMILFTAHNPKWIKSTIEETIASINDQYGEYIQNFNGQIEDIDLLDIVKKNFGISNTLFQLSQAKSSGTKNKKNLTASDIIA